MERKKHIFFLVAFIALTLFTLQSMARKKPTLVVNEGWRTDTLIRGVVYYHFESYDNVSKGYQVANVLEIDPKSDYQPRFVKAVALDSLSGEIEKYRNQGKDIIGGINGAYELEAVYVRINGRNISEVKLKPGHLRFWKHEGAIMIFKNKDVKIKFPSRIDGAKAIEYYKRSKATDILASAPMLIYNYKKVGSTFVDPQYRDWTINKLETLDYENKDRHQGVRHPRTAVALTKEGHLLLITIDGRNAGKCEGMNADELTRFLIKYFNPRYALNMDGGGSTTMCVKNHGEKKTEVVNCPTDNKSYDHWGQRCVSTFILIQKKE
jgi:hypothetical protein